MKNLVEIRELKFRYPGRQTWTLDLAPFEMKEGEKVFLFGPSGSGKSTLLELLSGVLEPTEGDVVVGGTSLKALTPSGRDHFRGNHLGYIFQSFNLIPYLSIRENIELPMRLNPHRGSRAKGSVDQEVAHLAQKLGLEDLLARKATELSVGQQQRVAAARALIGSPSLILADEPTSALDFDHRERFIQLLFDVAKETGAGVLFVSHDRGLKSLFDRAVELPSINRVK